MNTPPEPYKNQSRVKKTAKYLAAVSLVLLFSLWCYLADFDLVFDLFCQFRYQLSLTAIVLLLPLLVRKFRASLSKQQILLTGGACLLALALNVLAVLFCIQTEKADLKAQGAASLTVMQCNINSSNCDPEKMLKASQNADIIFLEEISPKLAEAINNKDGPVAKAYPYKIIRPRADNFGIGILSKLPIESSKIIENAESIPSIECLLSLGTTKLTVRAVHTLPPLSGSMYRSRNSDIKNLAIQAQTKTPLIIAGDFNCVPWSPHMKPIFLSGLKEASPPHSLPLPTWCTMLPMPAQIPIDHIFVSKDFAVHSVETGAQTGSDHLPIVAKLSLRPTK